MPNQGGLIGFVRVLGDSRELAAFTVNDGFGLERFSIDVTGIGTLRIELDQRYKQNIFSNTLHN